jgi:sulfate permease, SulP family
VNEGAGARSEMSPLVAAVLTVVTVLLLMPLFKNLPEAVLAALIIHAVFHLLKVHEFRRYYFERRIEFWLGLATLLGVVVIDVLPGLVIGVLAMLLLVVYRASRPHLGVLGEVPGAPGAYGNLERHPDYDRIPDLLVLRLDSPLFYANASLVCDRIKRLVGSSNPIPAAVVLEAGANPDLDITSAELLEQLVQSLQAAGIVFAIVDVRQPVVEMMRRSGLLATIGDDRVYHTIDEAVRSLRAVSAPRGV